MTRRPEGRFPKAERVRSRREFVAAQAQARRVVTPHFVFLICARRSPATGSEACHDAASAPGLRQPPPRLGITASRKVGNSVLRNRAKRLVREAFRATRDLWLPEIDVVIIVRHFDSALKLHDVTREWEQQSKQLRKRCHESLELEAGSRG